MKASCASVLVLALAFVSRVDAGEVLAPLYPYGAIPTLLKSPRVKTELKITKDQEPGVEAALKKYRAGFAKLTPGKPFDVYEIERTNVNGMLELLGKTLNPQQIQRFRQLILQVTGMQIFDHKEIREALNLDAAQVAKLKAVHGQLLKEISGGGKAKLSTKEVGKQFGDLMQGVPDKVRAALSDQQRKKLQELMGDNFHLDLLGGEKK